MSNPLSILIGGLLEGQEGRPLVSYLPAHWQRHRAEKALSDWGYLCPDLLVELEIRHGRWVLLLSRQPQVNRAPEVAEASAPPAHLIEEPRPWKEIDRDSNSLCEDTPYKGPGVAKAASMHPSRWKGKKAPYDG